MDVIPAIDLLDGQCVRLVQGRYERVIVYQRDPLEVAGQFFAEGARWLHIVDLNGARSGQSDNFAALRDIIARTGAHVQFGGGLRDEATIHQALEAGAERIIVGTRALEDPDWFSALLARPEYAGKLALGLDARTGKLATHGWTQQTQRRAVDVVREVSTWPLAAFIYTDIGRDGMLLGPNLEAIREVAAATDLPVIASGGVTELDDIRQLKLFRLSGVVIGRAIYEQLITLQDAIAAADDN